MHPLWGWKGDLIKSVPLTNQTLPVPLPETPFLLVPKGVLGGGSEEEQNWILRAGKQRVLLLSVTQWKKQWKRNQKAISRHSLVPRHHCYNFSHEDAGYHMQNSWILKINKYFKRAFAELYFHSKSWTRSKKNHETEAFCILQPLKYAVS